MNKLSKILIVVVFFLNALSVYSQAVTWQKWYDYNNLEDNGQDVIQTYDGGYIILSNSYTSLNPKTAVFKTDQFGKVEWQKLYDQNNIGGNFLSCFAITQVKDSGYIISGGNRDSAIIFKINKLGDVNWIKRYSKLGRSAGGFLDHKIAYDGGIIACGYLYDPSIGYVVKTDSIGNIQWDSVYYYTSDVLRIIESIDGSIYMLGIQNFTSGFLRNNKSIDASIKKRGLDSAILTKTNNFGYVIWKKFLFLPNPVDLIEHPSGNIFVGGGLDSMILYKINTSSSTIFQNSYYKGSNGCASMCLSRDGNILLAAILNTKMAASKIDPNGNLIFSKPISTIESPQFAFLPYTVNSTNDSGFIFTGFTNYPPTFHESNIFASKTDSVCNAALMVGISNNDVLIPESFTLYQNYPNPFNPNTKIKYDLSKTGLVNLRIFDVRGREICILINRFQEAGKYEIQFNSIKYNLPSGIFYCKMSVHQKSSNIKLVLIK